MQNYTNMYRLPLFFFPFFQDRFAEDRTVTPPIDESQDWILEFGEEKDGYTVLGFRRNITNCDPKDLDIQVSCMMRNDSCLPQNGFCRFFRGPVDALCKSV